jgi:hypothetical protein
MFERSEFVDPPPEIVPRGKPKAKVVGGLSFASLIHRKGECFALCRRSMHTFKPWGIGSKKSLFTFFHRSFGKAYDLLPRPEDGGFYIGLNAYRFWAHVHK